MSCYRVATQPQHALDAPRDPPSPRDTTPSTCDTLRMAHGATLKLDSGEEIRVEVDVEDLGEDEIVVRRSHPKHAPSQNRLLATMRRIQEAGTPSPAGTTDRLLQADRERPY